MKDASTYGTLGRLHRQGPHHPYYPYNRSPWRGGGSTPKQKLIDLYLLDCAKKRKKLTMKWVA